MHHPANAAPPGAEPEPLAQLILGYLAEHPRAMDTVEGIAEWWVLRQQARLALDNVARTVHELTTSGVLEQVGTGPASRYRLARTNEPTP
jgi:hypothetical protein